MNKKITTTIIALGLFSLLIYYLVIPKSPTLMRLIAQWEFESYTENEKINPSIFVRPELKYHKKEYVIFDWYVYYKKKDTLLFQVHIPQSNFEASRIVLWGEYDVWNELLNEYHSKYLDERGLVD